MKAKDNLELVVMSVDHQDSVQKAISHVLEKVPYCLLFLSSLFPLRKSSSILYLVAHELLFLICFQSGHIDALVNNAGHGIDGAFEDYSEEDVAKVFNTNVFGIVRTMQAVLPAMRAARRSLSLLSLALSLALCSLSLSLFWSLHLSLISCAFEHPYSYSCYHSPSLLVSLLCFAILYLLPAHLPTFLIVLRLANCLRGARPCCPRTAPVCCT